MLDLRDLGLQKQLKRWVDAGLLDPASASKIQEFESSQSSLSIGQWILGLGIFAIGIGLVALVASNWDGIPAMAKIVVDLVLLVLLGVAVFRFRFDDQKSMHCELTIGVLFFFSLASLALVGQIYQLDVELHRSLLTWLGITTPLMLLTRSSYLALLWAVVCAGTYISYIPALGHSLELSSHEEPVAIAYTFAGPLLFRAISVVPLIRQRFALHANALGLVSDLTTIIGAIVCSFIWYTDDSGMQDGVAYTCILATGVIALTATVFRCRLWPDHPNSLRWLAAGLWLVAWLSLALGFAPIDRTSLPSVAALFQFAILVLLIAWSLKLDMKRAFQFLIALACLRVLIVYFEVFGTLLDTGLALIGGGIITVAMAALWRSLVRRWPGVSQ